MSGVEQMELILERMARTRNNAEFLSSMNIPDSGVSTVIARAPARRLPRAA
jgi:hypothetical protein